jgi:hypothetical protein
MASMDPEPPVQSGHEVVDHFVGINEMIEMGKAGGWTPGRARSTSSWTTSRP